jgi:hypothetical protein
MKRWPFAHRREVPVEVSDDGLRRLGARLQEARLKRGEELEQAAAWLRIKPPFLLALEEGDRAAMPGRVYAKGFLRTYGEHLGLDGAALSARLDEALGVRDGHRDVQPGPPIARGMPDAMAVLAVLILGAAAAGTYFLADIRGGVPPRWIAQQDHLDGSSASAAEVAPVAALASADAEIGSRAVATSSTTGRVILVGRGAGLIRLTDATGDFVRSWVVGPGDWIPVPPHRGLALSTGDAGSVEILVDGRSIGTAGPAATVLRGLVLDPEALLARIPPS